jgi:anaerobic selenocysteine-containing dehydrogenase
MGSPGSAGPLSTHPHTCPLCEATCGLLVETRGDQVVGVRGDRDDVFSKGFACPKGLRIGDLHHDPDRLRTPLVDGRPTSWEHAWQTVHERLGRVIGEHGRQSLGLYLGNPNVHNLSGPVYGQAVARAMGSRNVFTASTTDQMPKQISALLMFGHALTIPIPDLDRTDLLVVLGADPLTSNGSLMTAPDMPGRLRALRHRGGRLVVVDPRTSRTARAADLHLAIRPGTDALLLAALVNVLLTEGLVPPAADLVAVPDLLAGLELLPEALAAFTPEAVAPVVGLPAGAVRDLARELAAAPSAAVYGRIGTTTVRFGTLGSWLVDVLNVLTGNLDRPGGAMFPLAPAGQRNSSPSVRARAPRFGRFATAERGLPELLGELPTAALAEEILGGHVRGLVTIAGNPALSAPDGDRLAKALDGLDVLVCVDLYPSETARYADVVLPVPSPLERPHFDLAFAQLAVRNVANWSPPVFPPATGFTDGAVPAEWRTLARLAGILQGAGADVDPDVVDTVVISTLVGQEVAAEGSPIHGRTVPEILAALAPRTGEERALDLLLRVGPYGDAFGARPDGLTLDRLAEHPHGLDLGPLQPRLPEVLRTVSGKVELAPQPLLDDLPRMRAALDEPADGLLLVGRRHLRSNNSWGHNVAALVGGSNRCTLQIHPDDAASAGLADGGRAVVSSAAGSVDVEVEVTDRIRPGVVSLPHGWGHGNPDPGGARLGVASRADGGGGVNTNVLTPPDVDPLSGTAILNGIPVTVLPVG